MAKAKRQRRNSIRTMSADQSALEALESLERAERSVSESDDDGGTREPAPAATGDPEGD